MTSEERIDAIDDHVVALKGLIQGLEDKSKIDFQIADMIRECCIAVNGEYHE